MKDRAPSPSPIAPILPISLILCSRGRAEMLRETVESILAGASLPAELIVVDQSDEPDRDLQGWSTPEGCRLRYLHDQGRGLSRANNLGAAAAAYDLLVFTHDDVRVEPDWLGALVEAARKGGADAVVTGRILAGVEDHGGGYAPTLRTGTEPETYRGRVGIDVLKPLNMAIPAELLRRVGGFDERLGPGTPFPGAEDADLGFRILEAGFTIHFVPEALLYHRAWRTEEEYLPLRWSYGVAHGAFYAKHFRWRDLHVPGRVVRDLARRIRRFPGRCFREGHRAWGDPLFVTGTLVGAARWALSGSRSAPTRLQEERATSP